jgi:hypothetical protein
MQVSSKWRTATLVAIALLAGSVIGPPLAQAAAAAAGLVRIEGAQGTHVAAVSHSGRLAVDTGLATTKAGQVRVAEADPAATVQAFGAVVNSCGAGGFYRIPKGKALIITGVEFIEIAGTSGAQILSLEVGPAATPCRTNVAESLASVSDTSENEVFSPGIPVPAGSAVGLNGIQSQGAAFMYGYLVPASAVPAGALHTLPTAVPGGLLHAAPPPR